DKRQVLKTVQHPRLIQIATSLVDGTLTITLPDGRTAGGVPHGAGERLTCNYWKRPVDLELMDGSHAALASEWLGKPVRLARAPRGAVVYGSALSIITTASLRDLDEMSSHLRMLAHEASYRA